MASNAENVSVWWRHHGMQRVALSALFGAHIGNQSSKQDTYQQFIGCNWFLFAVSRTKLWRSNLGTEPPWKGLRVDNRIRSDNSTNKSQSILRSCFIILRHDDVIKWKHFPRYWPFVHGIHRSPVNSPHKGQWRGALIFSLICVWINNWVNDREAGDSWRYCAHYDVIIMMYFMYWSEFRREL